MSRWAREVQAWIAGDPDEACRRELRDLLDAGDEAELARRFEHPLTFGTAGLRGEVMAGPGGMNRYTVRRTTQGVVAWLDELGVDLDQGVVVGRDARHGSASFADEVVSVLLGAGVRVHELHDSLPTPFVPYCVKALRAAAGVMITASHNPARDNGYKLYAGDGAQIAPPHDQVVERLAREALEHPALGERAGEGHAYVDDAVLEDYRQHVLNRFAPLGESDLALTYTPLHGVGGATMSSLFWRAGYHALSVVDEQFDPDPDFPTLPFPNPEEPGALDLAMKRADDVGSELVLANDPDADRLGVAVKTAHGWRVLRGDEVGWLLASALIDRGLSAGDVVATTIVSSTLLEKMARERAIDFEVTLTGFKWIARAARGRTLAFGYEEALGYAVDPSVPDKDGLSAALAVAGLAHQLAERGQRLTDRLDEIEGRYGVHATAQVSLRLEDASATRALVERLRKTPPTSLGGVPVSEVVDLEQGWRGLPATDGLVFHLSSSGRVIVRPSGTEPKVKFYLEVTKAPGASLHEARESAWALLGVVAGDVKELGERSA